MISYALMSFTFRSSPTAWTQAHFKSLFFSAFKIKIPRGLFFFFGVFYSLALTIAIYICLSSASQD